MKSLLSFSDAQLEASLKKLVSQERILLHRILEHIKEVARRELHLSKGFPTLKKYLIQEFGYSETAAARRMEAAKLLSEVPALGEKIKDGSVNLSVIVEMSRAIKEKEFVSCEKLSTEVKADLVACISGKSIWGAQQSLAKDLDIEIKKWEILRRQADGSVRFEGTISADLDLKLSRCRDLMAHKLQQSHSGHTVMGLVDAIADEIISSKTKLSKRDQAGCAMESGSESFVQSLDIKVGLKSVTPRTRKLVLLRDKCCQFKDSSTGKVCGSTFGLQVDHKISRWAGGSHAEENLQVLCVNHNRYKYRKEANLKFS